MRLFLIAGVSMTLAALAAAQSTDAWLTYHGDYTGQRHSRLAQISPDNVGRLERVWRFQASSFIRASMGAIEGRFSTSKA